ncbi:MAG TPA: LysM domain-containing protein [Pyrinomonadaceae bacterium]
MNYTVKSGDTLSRIAKQNGLTLAQLLDANPAFKPNPNKLKVGDVLSIPDGVSTTPASPSPAPVTPNQKPADAIGGLGTAMASELGNLSAKYETGGRGAGVVSTGVGDPGGVSYGSYQMATKTGTAKRFVTQSDFQWKDDFQGLAPGTAAFSAKWKQLAAAEPIAFQEAQHEFIKRTHYDPLVAKTLSEENLDINKRGRALQDVVWSTSVQHGGNCVIVRNALKTIARDFDSSGFDENLIRAIYAERGRKRADGNLAWFSKSSQNVQAGVAKRFKNELNDALAMLG